MAKDMKAVKKAAKTAKPSGLPVEKPASNMAVGVSSRMSKEDEDRERRWKAESALETIQRAEQHKKDKMLMRDVKAMAKEKMAAMKKVCE